LALRGFDELRIVAYAFTHKLVPWLRPVESDDLATGGGVDEFEAGEVQQQCAGEAGVAPPVSRVAAFLVIERDQERLLGEDEPHGRTLAETLAFCGFTFVPLRGTYAIRSGRLRPESHRPAREVCTCPGSGLRGIPDAPHPGPG
jgi:hypothetical protein